MSAFTPPKESTSRRYWAIELWQTYVESGDMTTLLVAAILLLMPAVSLYAADWPIRIGITAPIIVVSLLFGYVLARSRYNELYSLIVSTLYGLIAVLILASLSISFNPIMGLEQVVIRTVTWFYDAATGGINQDNLVFTMIVSFLFWFFGYNAAWHIFRIDRVWRVIIPPGLILIVNMIISSKAESLEIYLMIFVLMSLLLTVRSNLDVRQWDWYSNSVRVPRHVRRQFIMAGTVISLVALPLAWAIPSGNLQERITSFQEFLASDGIRQMSEFFNRLVEPIESDGPATADYYGGDSLNLGGAISLGDQIIMLVDVPNDGRYYWRSRVFERYENGRWLPSATHRVADLDPPLEIFAPADGDLGRITIRQTVTMNVPSRLIYTIPQPFLVDLPGRIDLLRISSNQDDTSASMNVSVIRPDRVIGRGISYQATSAMSVATAYELRAAGVTYPQWVMSPNAIAINVTPRTADLARQIVAQAGATTPYDQAKAIERYLRETITYNERITVPPAGVDPVEWFLFDVQEGYCTYYATAMVSMLRSLGIPARIAAGFAQGTYDPSLGEYVVRERDAHTWVEVYFPGYGWVEFEPTSAQAPLNRDGDNAPQQQNPDNPITSSVPTPTPTLLPSPTPQATPTADEASVPEDSPQESQSTPTFTPSPTPTVTPIILPTIAPPVSMPDPSANFLSFLLPALGLALTIFLIVLFIVLIILLIIWWWEWRGMGGLSPISRAYARLLRYIKLIGMHRTTNQTPEENRRQIIRQLPQAERPVSTITRNYMRERYRKPESTTPENARIRQVADTAWRDTRSSILKRWFRRLIPFLKD